MPTRSRVDAALDRALQDRAAGVPADLTAAMRYSLLAGGKRLRPMLALGAAEACAAPLGVDAGDGVDPGAARRLRARVHPHLLADPRRSAVDGQRHDAARAADLARRVRRGDGHSGRRRVADRGVRADGAGTSGAPGRSSRRPRGPHAARARRRRGGRRRGRHGRRTGARSAGDCRRRGAARCRGRSGRCTRARPAR